MVLRYMHSGSLMQGTGKFGRAGKEVNNAQPKAQSYSLLSPEHRAAAQPALAADRLRRARSVVF